MPEQITDSGDRRPGAWQCPTCGRHIPRQIEVCRCGSERKRLEALGYQFASGPPVAARPSVRPAARQRGQTVGLAGTLVGYQIDTNLSPGLRGTLKGLFVMAVLAVGAALVHYTHTDPLPIRDNIQILTTLDAFTRNAAPDSGNTIPSFVASAGRLGVLSESGTPSDPVRAVAESQLAEGFCTRSIVKQVRHDYAGYYENVPDDKLERLVREKHPEYTDRVCALSARFDVAAADIIKYEMKPRSILGYTLLWLRTLTFVGVFAGVCLNVYYRLIIERLVPPLDAAA